MAATIRPLDDDDTDAMTRGFRDAFGSFDPPEPPVPLHAPGKNWFGAEVDGRLAATALDREYTTWFGGVRVPTAGIGGVSVAAERRGEGLLGPVFDVLHEAARERGAVISTLFATAPAIYRRWGYESFTSLDRVRLSTAGLAVGGSTPLRRADEDDAAAIRAVHDRGVSRRNGPLSRTGPLFAEAPTVRVDGVTVAERDGVVVGYVAWDRGRGYGEGAELAVHDLEADDVDALRSLLTMLSTFASTVPSVVVRTSGIAPWRHLVGRQHATPVSSAPYAITVLDVRAFELVPAPPGLTATLPFTVDGVTRTLEIADGRTHVVDGGTGGRELTHGGLSLTFAGAHRSADLRLAGHLDGPDTDDAAWDALTLRGPLHVHDYF